MLGNSDRQPGNAAEEPDRGDATREAQAAPSPEVGVAPDSGGIGASPVEAVRSAGAGLLEWCLHWGKIVLRIVAPPAVIWLIWHDLRSLNIHKVREQLDGADPMWLLWAAVATAAAIGSMGLYDALAFRSTPTLSASRRWRFGMLFFSWTNFLTLGPIGGPAVRLYFYRKAGLETGEILKGLVRLYTGVFSGLGAWAVASLVPHSLGDAALPMQIAAAAALGPLFAMALWQASRRIKRTHDGSVGWRVFAILGLISVLDWGGVLAAFVATGRAVGADIPAAQCARTLFLGHIAGMASMIPGGLGSADAVWLWRLTAEGVGHDVAAASILLFRAIFYVGPWLFSMAGLYIMFAEKWGPAVRWQRRILAAAVVVNAALLLASTATPAVQPRLRWLEDAVPIGALEASHAAAVVAAATMLFLVRGLLRGYRAAFLVTGAALVASVFAHLLKGGDYEEATVSLILLLLLFGARRSFTRRGRMPIGWELTTAAALGSVAFFVIVGMATFERFHYRPEMWLRFSAHAERARVLRGGALLACVGAAFLIRQAMLPVKQRIRAAPREIDRAIAFISNHAEHGAALNVGSGDKRVWFWGDQGLVVYQRSVDALIVFSDPVVAAPGTESDLLYALHEMAEQEDLDLHFYQITPAWMEHLHDFGYTFFKLGEEAVVPVAGFDLAGGEKTQMRKTLRRVEGEGVTFQVVAPPHAESLIDECRDVSDAWLHHKNIDEMQFSLGYFSPQYLQRFPLGLARDRSGRLVGFVNLLCAKPGAEVTFDFMRYRSGEIDNIMDYIIIKSMLWAGEHAYSTLNLGMSPLFDVGRWRKASLVERAARLLYKHGERVYNYRGLQEYKRKFHPVWEPRYLAYQRPWDWPSAVLATTALIKARSREARRRIEAARLGSVEASAGDANGSDEQ